MHRIRSGVLGMALAVAFAGCGDSTIEEGPGGFTPTDTKPLDPMANQMKEMMKKKDYTKAPIPPRRRRDRRRRGRRRRNRPGIARRRGPGTVGRARPTG